MALEDMFKGDLGTGLLVGFGALVLAPIAGRVLRPAAKAVIKGGMTLYRDTGIGDAAEDLVAEARTELDHSRHMAERHEAEHEGAPARRGRRVEQPA
ncbi:hypothetical protein [Sphingomonas oleivorans]|uniref:hypothetical protein n=1 Tax=Sphingomonas oleivorans TaxID=1735121 RepID=UPI001A9CBF41|nr:hypothetical protein [Sphingomonas oleivorans]